MRFQLFPILLPEILSCRSCPGPEDWAIPWDFRSGEWEVVWVSADLTELPSAVATPGNVHISLMLHLFNHFLPPNVTEAVLCNTCRMTTLITKFKKLEQAALIYNPPSLPRSIRVCQRSLWCPTRPSAVRLLPLTFLRDLLQPPLPLRHHPGLSFFRNYAEMMPG